MLHIFRKIRNSMIQQNRVTKYILYAFGEILLVVLGILIALQVNNWNQSQQLIEKEVGYLKNIKANLDEDLAVANSVLEFNKQKRAVFDSLVVYFDANIDRRKITEFLVPTHMPIISSFELFQINKTAFENMKSANDISIISDEDLRYQLSDYYANDPLIGTQERVFESSRTFRAYITRKMMHKEAIDFYLKTNSLIPKFEELEDFRGEIDFYYNYFDVQVVMDAQDRYVQEFINQIKLLIKAIERELEGSSS